MIEQNPFTIDLTTCSITEYKQYLYNRIDGRTAQLLGAGFVFDSYIFSLSINAQANWNSLKHDTSSFIFPKNISTLNSDTYSLLEEDVNDFWTAGKDVVEPILDGGREVKKLVFDATTKEELSTITDPR